MDAMADSTLIIDQKTKRLYDPIGESPLSITQPLESSFEEISLHPHLPLSSGLASARVHSCCVLSPR